MARRKKNDGMEGQEAEEKKKSKFVTIAVVVLVILIWLGVFLLLIKFDVGNFGSSVLRPVFKDVPVINKILPEATDEELANQYPYKSLGEAISYIKELELQLQQYQESDTDNSEKIAELEAEIARLQIFELNQQEFEEIKGKFYEEVVFGENALDYENYKVFYESIDPENAERIYQQVVNQIQIDEMYKDFAKTYSSMDAKNAASIFAEMSGDLDIVVGIMNAMSAADRGEIMAELSNIDPVFAAKVTKLLRP